LTDVQLEQMIRRQRHGNHIAQTGCQKAAIRNARSWPKAVVTADYR
jgi:hypothetical protein